MKRIKKLLGAFMATNLVVISIIVITHNIGQYKHNKLQIDGEREKRLSIVTTNKMIYNMVKNLSGERHDVRYMMKKDEEQWSFNYTKDSVNSIGMRDIFVYMGAGYEPWMYDFAEELKRSNVSVVNASRGIRVINLTTPKKFKDKDIKENPYFWLSPDEYKNALLNVKNAIVEKDARNIEFYGKLFDENVKVIDKLTKELKEAIDKLEDKVFIVNTDELDYFTRYWGIKTLKINNMTKEEREKNFLKLKDKKMVALYTDVSQIKDIDEMTKSPEIQKIGIFSKIDGNKYENVMENNISAIKMIK